MTEFKSFLLGIFLLLVMIACGDSKTASSTVKANVTASTPAPIEKPVIISGKDVTVKSGAEFCVNIEVANFVDVVSMQYSTNWDVKALEYQRVQNFNLNFLAKDNFGRAKGEERTFYQTCFKAIGKSGTTTEIDFANEPMIAEIGNSKMKPMKTDLQSVKVTIE